MATAAAGSTGTLRSPAGSTWVWAVPAAPVLPDRQGTSSATESAPPSADRDRLLARRRAAGDAVRFPPTCSYLHLSPFAQDLLFCHEKHTGFPPGPSTGAGLAARDLGGGRAASSSGVAFRCAKRHVAAVYEHSFVLYFQQGFVLSCAGLDDRLLPLPRPRPRPFPFGVWDRGAGEC